MFGWIQSVSVHYKQFFIIYYVSEHQLSPAIDASHTTPITHVNQDYKLLKLIGWRYCPYFKWVPYIPKPRPQFLGVESDCTARYSVTVISLWKQWNSKQCRLDASHPREPYSRTFNWLHNLYPRSTQNTDIVSSINFLNPSVNYPFTLLFNLVKQSKFMLLE